MNEISIGSVFLFDGVKTTLSVKTVTPAFSSKSQPTPVYHVGPDANDNHEEVSSYDSLLRIASHNNSSLSDTGAYTFILATSAATDSIDTLGTPSGANTRDELKLVFALYQGF